MSMIVSRRNTNAGIHLLLLALVILHSFCITVHGFKPTHHAVSSKSNLGERDNRRLETSSGLNSDVGHHGDINPRQSTVDIAFNKQDATIQASVALCERACLQQVADQGTREEWECSKQEYIEKVCDDKYIPWVRTTTLAEARVASDEWKFCVQSRWFGRCASQPTGENLRQICRCKACFWYNVPITYENLNPPPVTGPLNNYVSAYCPKFSKLSAELKASADSPKPAPEIKSQQTVSPVPTACDDVCKESAENILIAGMCWYHPNPPQRKDGKNRRLCQWPTQEQNKICLQARNIICFRPDADNLVQWSWYGPKKQLSPRIYRTKFELTRYETAAVKNQGHDNSGLIYRRAVKAITETCTKVCKVETKFL